MTQYTVKDYVSLINKLLQCPKGEEWVLFNQHQDLVNHEMVQVLEQISQNFTRHGDPITAQFLHQWAGEIQQHLKQEALQHSTPLDQDRYDELIQLLLDCPEGYESRILTQQKAMVDHKLLDRMRTVAQTMAINGELENAQYLIDLATQINQTFNAVNLQNEGMPDPNINQPEKSHDLKRAVLNAKQSMAVESTDPLNYLSPDSYATTFPKLDALLQSLDQLATAIKKQTNSMSKLSYLDILEKAHLHKWLLTTHELKAILGTKPHYSSSTLEYHHGGWRFVKCGKVGRNTLWQVFKLKPLEIIPSEQKSNSNSDSSLPISIMEADPWIA